MIAAVKNEHIIVEALSIAILSAAVTTIVIESINRNKPETKTQEQKMTELLVGIGVTVGVFFFSKKVLK